ncbi:MAG TPA: TIGR02587 family membrane protein [Pyrinomonadaceae bacterium]|nr:TIGR02587 family membrane protein [Pyrinomonadaceae bacterium]
MNITDEIPEPRAIERTADRRFAIGLARAFAGALIFSLPMLMTMEMWALGFYMSNLRLALFLLVVIPLLIGLSHYIGFEETFDWREDGVDAFVAYAVGFVASAVALLFFAVIEPGMSFDEIIGKISLQAVPASIGAMLAQSELGGNQEEKERRKREPGFGGELFFMAVGAVFLAFNLAPTEEIVLIAHKMTPWHAVGLALVSLLIMHAFVYALEFQGQHSIPGGTPFWSEFLRFTVVGYALALLTSLFILWTFGRIDGLAFHEIVVAVIVLAFPAAVGAAAARLIL